MDNTYTPDATYASNVDHPQHYQTKNGIECIDAIQAAQGPDEFLGFCKGIALKYLRRAKKKDQAQQGFKIGLAHNKNSS